MCRLLFGVRSTAPPLPVLPRWHVKDPGHSAKSAGGRVHISTHTSLTQRSRSGLTAPLSRQSVGIHHETSSHAARRGTLARSQSSQLAELLGTDPGLNSEISLCELISTLQKKKHKLQEPTPQNILCTDSYVRVPAFSTNSRPLCMPGH